MAWNTLYVELPIFQTHFGGAVTCPFKKLFVSMTLYGEVSNRNDVVRHAMDVSAASGSAIPDKRMSPLGPDGLPAASEPDCKGMLDFELVHLVLNPEMIVSADHVSYAISRAVTNVLNRKVHSAHFTTEVVYMMGGSSSVTKCMDEMCIQTSRTDNTCKAMLAVSISKTKLFGDLETLVRGAQVPIEELQHMRNNDKIAKVRNTQQ
ncbi:EKC KEOPS complex subunit TPRKB [Babesia ovata]|uniref:EKC KEOPS complex subunit TPRKB n=1 Tax=Babesia ovata TaxID=189622 RepID=A0A2H6K9R9_9APIC|nr:EKC KEOPS complex subunit TPRKB [Babesia ovata]GBE59752.1 EKC KEOPS complex subunit TPRKB [Babesia ovata]